ncbi:uncharacterized protein LOC135484862 [Lineus longissimus]|uniref:uncharacterized protein LOC135484862 n=1 Tax=Lineus longissimus TaxID=88925 RepID=UPI00315CC63D
MADLMNSVKSIVEKKTSLRGGYFRPAVLMLGSCTPEPPEQRVVMDTVTFLYNNGVRMYYGSVGNKVDLNYMMGIAWKEMTFYLSPDLNEEQLKERTDFVMTRIAEDGKCKLEQAMSENTCTAITCGQGYTWNGKMCTEGRQLNVKVDLILQLDASSYTGPVFYKEMTEVLKQLVDYFTKNVPQLQIVVVYYASQASSTSLLDAGRLDLLATFKQKIARLPYQGSLPKVTAALDEIVKLKTLRADAKKLVMCLGSCTPEPTELTAMVKTFNNIYMAGYQIYQVRGAVMLNPDMLKGVFANVNVFPLKIKSASHNIIRLAEEVFDKFEKEIRCPASDVAYLPLCDDSLKRPVKLDLFILFDGSAFTGKLAADPSKAVAKYIIDHLILNSTNTQLTLLYYTHQVKAGYLLNDPEKLAFIDQFRNLPITLHPPSMNQALSVLNDNLETKKNVRNGTKKAVLFLGSCTPVPAEQVLIHENLKRLYHSDVRVYGVPVGQHVDMTYLPEIVWEQNQFLVTKNTTVNAIGKLIVDRLANDISCPENKVYERGSCNDIRCEKHQKWDGKMCEKNELRSNLDLVVLLDGSTYTGLAALTRGKQFIAEILTNHFTHQEYVHITLIYAGDVIATYNFNGLFTADSVRDHIKTVMALPPGTKASMLVRDLKYVVAKLKNRDVHLKTPFAFLNVGSCSPEKKEWADAFELMASIYNMGIRVYAAPLGVTLDKEFIYQTVWELNTFYLNQKTDLASMATELASRANEDSKCKYGYVSPRGICVPIKCRVRYRWLDKMCVKKIYVANKKFDIFILLDGSGYTGVENFHKARAFVMELVQLYKVGKDHLRIIVIYYASQVTVLRIGFTVPSQILIDKFILTLKHLEADKYAPQMVAPMDELFREIQKIPKRQAVPSVILLIGACRPVPGQELRIRSRFRKLYKAGIRAYTIPLGIIQSRYFRMSIVPEQNNFRIPHNQSQQKFLHFVLDRMQRDAGCPIGQVAPKVACEATKCEIYQKWDGIMCKDTVTAGKSATKKIDLFIMMDASIYTGEAGVRHAKDFIVQFMQNFQIDQTGTRLFIIRYAKSVEVLEVATLTPDITKKVENLNYEPAKPDMMKAMIALNSVLRTSTNVRREKDVHKAILYIGSIRAREVAAAWTILAYFTQLYRQKIRQYGLPLGQPALQWLKFLIWEQNTFHVSKVNTIHHLVRLIGVRVQEDTTCKWNEIDERGSCRRITCYPGFKWDEKKGMCLKGKGFEFKLDVIILLDGSKFTGKANLEKMKVFLITLLEMRGFFNSDIRIILIFYGQKPHVLLMDNIKSTKTYIGQINALKMLNELPNMAIAADAAHLFLRKKWKIRPGHVGKVVLYMGSCKPGSAEDAAAVTNSMSAMYKEGVRQYSIPFGLVPDDQFQRHVFWKEAVFKFTMAKGTTAERDVAHLLMRLRADSTCKHMNVMRGSDCKHATCAYGLSFRGPLCHEPPSPFNTILLCPRGTRYTPHGCIGLQTAPCPPPFQKTETGCIYQCPVNTMKVGQTCVAKGVGGAKGTDDCKKTHDGKTYNGKVSKTRSGRNCQSWASQVPHKHTENVSNFPDGTLAKASNYCRNPSGAPEGPWCYSTDPAVPKEYCNVPLCRVLGSGGKLFSGCPPGFDRTSKGCLLQCPSGYVRKDGKCVTAPKTTKKPTTMPGLPKVGMATPPGPPKAAAPAPKPAGPPTVASAPTAKPAVPNVPHPHSVKTAFPRVAKAPAMLITTTTLKQLLNPQQPAITTAVPKQGPCPPHHEFTTKGCVLQCKPGESRVKGVCRKATHLSCPPGNKPSPKGCIPTSGIKCPPNFQPDAHGQCVLKCPTGYVRTHDGCHFKATCPGGLTLLHGKCIANNQYADIVIAIDQSADLGSVNLALVKSFVEFFIHGLDISKDKMRVGVVGFSNNVYIYGYLDSFNDKKEIPLRLMSMKTLAGHADMGKLFHFVGSSMFKTKGARAGVQKILIILGGGKSINPANAAKEAAALRNHARIFYVGVGTHIDPQQLWGLTYQGYWFIVKPSDLLGIVSIMVEKMVLDLRCHIGYQMVKSTCFKMFIQFVCPTGMARHGHTCTFYRCPPDYVHASGICLPSNYQRFCPPGYLWSSMGHCSVAPHTICPLGTQQSGYRCADVACYHGLMKYGQVCAPTLSPFQPHPWMHHPVDPLVHQPHPAHVLQRITCPPNTVTVGFKCRVPCPANSVIVGGQCKAVGQGIKPIAPGVCPAGYILQNSLCSQTKVVLNSTLVSPTHAWSLYKHRPKVVMAAPPPKQVPPPPLTEAEREQMKILRRSKGHNSGAASDQQQASTPTKNPHETVAMPTKQAQPKRSKHAFPLLSNDVPRKPANQDPDALQKILAEIVSDEFRLPQDQSKGESTGTAKPPGYVKLSSPKEPTLQSPLQIPAAKAFTTGKVTSALKRGVTVPAEPYKAGKGPPGFNVRAAMDKKKIAKKRIGDHEDIFHVRPPKPSRFSPLGIGEPKDQIAPVDRQKSQQLHSHIHTVRNRTFKGQSHVKVLDFVNQRVGAKPKLVGQASQKIQRKPPTNLTPAKRQSSNVAAQRPQSPIARVPGPASPLQNVPQKPPIKPVSGETIRPLRPTFLTATPKVLNVVAPKKIASTPREIRYSNFVAPIGKQKPSLKIPKPSGAVVGQTPANSPLKKPVQFGAPRSKINPPRRVMPPKSPMLNNDPVASSIPNIPQVPGKEVPDKNAPHQAKQAPSLAGNLL